MESKNPKNSLSLHAVKADVGTTVSNCVYFLHLFSVQNISVFSNSKKFHFEKGLNF